MDSDTGDEVPNEDIVKGYQIQKAQFIEVSKEELEEIALESARTIEIDEFVDLDRHRSALPDPPLLHPHRRQGRPRRARGDPRDHPRDG